jgi:hypothetical protein
LHRQLNSAGDFASARTRINSARIDLYPIPRFRKPDRHRDRNTAERRSHAFARGFGKSMSMGKIGGFGRGLGAGTARIGGLGRGLGTANKGGIGLP